MKRLCVFCGSQVGTQPEYAEAARELGTDLARRGWGLVTGGGRIGLMGEVASATTAAGGHVVGVIPHSLSAKEIAYTAAAELIEVDSMHERKAIMADRADAFVALPGGFGTCDELFEILTWAQLGIHRKPVALLNVCGFFNPLLNWIGHMTAEGFLKPHYRGLLLVVGSVEELFAAVERYQPVEGIPTWIRSENR